MPQDRYSGEIEIVPPLPRTDMNDCRARFARRPDLCWRVEDEPGGQPSALRRHAVAVCVSNRCADSGRVVEDLQRIVTMFPDHEFTGYIEKIPDLGHGVAAPSRITVRARRVVEFTAAITWPAGAGFEEVDVHGAVAAELRRAGFPEREVNEYGSTVGCGWRVEASGEEAARVEYKMPDPDLTDPDRMTRNELYWARRHWRDAYAAVLTAAGFHVETKTVHGNRSIALACFGGAR